LLQISLPCLLFAPNPSTDQGLDATTALDAAESALLTVKGGTNAANAPAVDYTQHIFLSFLRKHLGLQPTLEIRKRGFYPKGGGELFMRIPTVSGPLKAFNLTKLPGRVTHIRGRAFVAGALPIVMAEQMSRAAHDALRNAEELKSAWPKIDIEEVKENNDVAVGSGSGVFLWAETEDGCIYGGTSIGQKGRDTAKVGKEAAHELMKGLLAGGCVDEYLQVSLIANAALWTWIYPMHRINSSSSWHLRRERRPCARDR
jgi:RNA 3'-terminal phosphate cyclase (ATP)